MPNIGIPSEITGKSNFQNIKMNNSSSKGELLNSVTGAIDKRGDGVKYVDAKSHNKMGKDDFLKLLSHQLQHQDPFDPMKQDKLSAELAQYSQLEQLTNINQNIQGMTSDKSLQDKFYGATFLGKEVVSRGSSINVKESGEASNMIFNLTRPAQEVIVRILDDKNQMVRQIELKNLPAGSNTATWDGISADQSPAPKGKYTFSVQAWDEKMSPIEVKQMQKGQVAGVSFENGEALFTLDNGSKVYLRDVDAFSVPHMEQHQTGKNIPSSPNNQTLVGSKYGKVGESLSSNANKQEGNQSQIDTIRNRIAAKFGNNQSAGFSVSSGDGAGAKK